MLKNDAIIIPHCDSSDCCLGSIHFTCPKCNKYCIDYVIWWEWESLNHGDKFSFISDSTDGCNCKLVLNYDNYRMNTNENADSNYFITINEV